MAGTLRQHYQRLAKFQEASQAIFRQGLMEIRLPYSGSPDLEIYQAEANPVTAPVETPARKGIGRGQLEIAFTILNAVTTLLAFLGQQPGFLSPTAIIALYVVAYGTGGYYGLMNGIAVLRERRLDVNLLMILAAVGAAIIGQPAEGTALLFLFSLSNTLQTYAMGRSRKAIEKLLDLCPPVATVRRGSRLTSLPVEKLVLGNTVLVRPGERFPIDGEVTSGSSSADQSTITGESIPVHKEPGSSVFAGTVNGTGALEIRVTRLAQGTTLAKIVQMVEDAQANKAQTQRMLDNFEQIYAVLVLGGAVLLAIVPYFLLGKHFTRPFTGP